MTTRVQYYLAKSLERFYKELGKLSTTPEEITDYSAERVSIKLYNHVRETDELMQLRVTNAFAKSTWKKIHVRVEGHETRGPTYQEDVITLCNSIFRGLAQNSSVEEFIWAPTADDLPVLPVTIPSLPPNLRDLYLSKLDLREDEDNNRKGLPELIQQHKNLKMLHMINCQVNPKGLGIALSCNGSVERLNLVPCSFPMDEFFDSINNNTLQTLDMSSCSNALGISGLEAMQRALKEKRLAPQKLMLSKCFGKNEVHAVATMLEDDTTITELDLSCNEIGDDGVAIITSSLRNNVLLRDLKLQWLGGCTTKSHQVIKDFVKSRPDGTLERIHFTFSKNWFVNQRIIEEINTLLDINKLTPLIQESQGVPLSVLQHERLDCTYYFIRHKPEVCLKGAQVEESTEEPPLKRQKMCRL